MKKSLSLLIKNIEYTILLFVGIVLFSIFSNGLLGGIITALSAVIVYISAYKLYKEFIKSENK